ncbi:pyridoxal phosphate-dependent transferase [Cokeromyces recurvatus]|uniref:pyridoxal phosphate-dependent transferase n=1 Tax=Cokeromyces recurvatus TaxID=90255 RepID=UPI0022203D51|nr:pyridoxal phosphate-dependent transferase [Cokeromyces recurvatus]KAI7902172.1 pyridoxal phosphate-dependent transferase [Cokeromyces recurvatus]
MVQEKDTAISGQSSSSLEETIPFVSIDHIQPSTRQRSFSLSNLVKRTRRAYSVSSAYHPTPRPSFDFFSNMIITETKLTPAQRRNSIAAAQRKYEDFEQKIEAAPLFVLVSTYLNYLVLILFGHLRDIIGKVFKRKEYAHLRTSKGYAPLVSDFDSFYTRRMYLRIRDCWNRPTTGVPGRKITILERESNDFNKTFKMSGKKLDAINFSSYNYLGFAQNKGICADQVEECVKEYGMSSVSPRLEAGTLDLHRKLEKIVANFVGKEDSIVVSMGFATNSTTIPALVSKGCLVISDELNHSSIVFGVRISGASVRVFKHNNMIDLRNLLREVISQGQPRTHRPWKKIIVIVEGLYSMEGSIVNLPELIKLKKEFKFYLYVDEAHSIGALGENGGGVCDFYGINPKHIDLMMGTFTKSFGSAGGYIAGDKTLIDYLRVKNYAFSYAESMSPPVIQQIISSMQVIRGEDGTDDGRKRIQTLAENARYFSNALRKMGFIVYGDEGSPVIPLLLFNPAKISAFSREMLKRGIAIVVVGYPATPIISSRARFCISSAHTKEDLDKAIQDISEVGDILMLKAIRLPDIGSNVVWWREREGRGRVNMCPRK